MLLLTAAMLVFAPVDTTLVQQFATLLAATPIERLETHPGSPAVTDVILSDLDRDGNPEAVVSIRPALRQTPTVLIFRRTEGGAWQRILEGLAPGRLRPVSGKLVDTHVHRVGADLTAGDGSPEENQRVLAAVTSQGMSMVAYRDFMHMDTRIGMSFVIDLSTWPLPPGTTKSCGLFEFSQPESVVAGTLDGGGDQQCLVVLTEEDLTIYRVDSITDAGRLVARSWLLPRPPEATALMRDEVGTVHVVTQAGPLPLRAP